jgi:hypothetical protein
MQRIPFKLNPHAPPLKILKNHVCIVAANRKPTSLCINNPKDQGKYTHTEIHTVECDLQDCEKKQCTLPVCGNEKKEESVANFTSVNKIQGQLVKKVIELDPNINFTGQAKAQYAAIYVKPETTTATETVPHRSATTFLNQPHVSQKMFDEIEEYRKLNSK